MKKFFGPEDYVQEGDPTKMEDPGGIRITPTNRNIVLIGLAILVVTFAVLQLWSFSREYTNPPVVREPEWDSARTRQLAQQACFDCHSHQTSWPWYSHIIPMSFKIQYDVVEGRRALNFSNWKATYTQAEIDQMAEVVGKKQMPLPYYIVVHPEAELTSGELGDLTNGLIKTMQKSRQALNGDGE